MFAIVLFLSVCAANVLLKSYKIARAEEARIIGRRPADVDEFPYQVLLRDTRSGSHFCGGSIISNDWILTAAHCVPNLRPNDLVVVVGTNYLSSGGQSYYVAQITSHGSYNPQSNVNDIALIKISGTITYAPGVSSIGLANSTTSPGSELVFSGWGLTSYPSNTLPDALQTINLNSISLAQCQSLLPGYPIFSTHLCTYVASGLGPCRGDAGGPLVLNGLQHGILSWGIPCATGNPDVFTSVSAYRTWIKSNSGL